MYNLTFLPFDNTLINVDKLTHVVKQGDLLHLYFGNQEPSLIFGGKNADQLYGLLLSHQKPPTPTLSVRV